MPPINHHDGVRKRTFSQGPSSSSQENSQANYQNYHIHPSTPKSVRKIGSCPSLVSLSEKIICKSPHEFYHLLSKRDGELPQKIKQALTLNMLKTHYRHYFWASNLAEGDGEKGINLYDLLKALYPEKVKECFTNCHPQTLIQTIEKNLEGIDNLNSMLLLTLLMYGIEEVEEDSYKELSQKLEKRLFEKTVAFREDMGIQFNHTFFHEPHRDPEEVVNNARFWTHILH